MKFDIEFAYRIEYVVARRRTPSYERAKATARVDIVEVPGEDARLVFECSTKVDPRYDEVDDTAFRPIPTADGKSRPARFVEIDGRLYRERCRVEDLAGTTWGPGLESPFHVGRRGNPGVDDLIRESAYDDPGKWEFYDLASISAKVAESLGGTRWDPKPVPKDLFRSYNDDAGKSRIGAIMERASELRVVDGSVYAPSSEPVIAIAYGSKTDGHDDAPDYTLVVADSRDGGLSAFSTGGQHPLYAGRFPTFPIDRMDLARDYLASMGALDAAADLTWIGAVSRADVRHDPARNVRQAAASLVSTMGHSVRLLSPSAACAFAVLRDAERSSPTWLTKELVEAVRDALAALEVPGAVRSEHRRRDPRDPENPNLDRLDVGNVVHRMQDLDAHALGAALSRAPAVPTSEQGGIRAAQVVSAMDRASLALALGSRDLLAQAGPGDVLVAVEAKAPRDCLAEARPHGLFLFDAEGNLVDSLGPSEGRPSAAALDLATAHSRMVFADLTDHDLDDADVAALSMD